MRRPIAIWWALVRFGFHLLYNEFAWTYDLVSWIVSMGHWRRWQRASIPYLKVEPGGLVLELAHGTADLQVDLATAGFKAIGCDLSPYMGRIARRKLTGQGLAARLVRADVGHLPFPDGIFDSVISTFPTEFIASPSTLREAHRVLKPGGRLVIVPNAMLTLFNPIVWFLEWLYRITGQRDDWTPKLQEIYSSTYNPGFEIEVRVESFPGSRVWIVIATRLAE